MVQVRSVVLAAMLVVLTATGAMMPSCGKKKSAPPSDTSTQPNPDDMEGGSGGTPAGTSPPDVTAAPE